MTRPPYWTPLRRVAMRFAVSLFILTFLPFPFVLIPWLGDRIVELTDKLWSYLVYPVGEHVFHQKIVHDGPTGSGDTTFDWVFVACTIFFSLIITLAWSALSRRKEYDRLYGLLRVGARYFLATTMLGYGLSKVVVQQFPAPDAYRMVEPIGEASPMGLLWTMMGLSPAYEIFGGLAETIGAVFLLFRRTTTLGALILVGVMTNVVMLNFCYDVPVKIFSSQLLLVAFFLMLPDLRALTDFLVRGRIAHPAPLVSSWPARWPRAAYVVAKVAVIGLILYSQAWAFDGPPAAATPLLGAWSVDTMTLDGQDMATKDERWLVVGVGPYGARVRLQNAPALRLGFKADNEKKTLEVTARDAPNAPETWAYEQHDAEHVTVSGLHGGKAIALQMHRVATEKSLLITRGFHWVNEFPFNR